MIRFPLALALAFALAGCCAPAPTPPEPPQEAELPPPPPPSPPPLPPKPSGVNVAGLATIYRAAATRLDAYLAQPRCSAAGPIECTDPAIVGQATDARRQARRALDAAERQEAVLRAARSRIEAFQNVVGGLPVIGD